MLNPEVHPMTDSMERDRRSNGGEFNEVTPGWERIRVQNDPGAIDTVGPKKISKAFEVK